MTSQSSRRDLLLKTTSSFCQSLLNPPPPPDLIKTYFTPTNPRITEHGPEWACSRLPFLAKTFTGQAGCEEYFVLLSQMLKMQMDADAFLNLSGYVVDSEAVAETRGQDEGKGMVSVVGKGTFQSVGTGREWQEKFIYRFSGFDEEGRIGHWEIWADPLSAWDAVGE